LNKTSYFETGLRLLQKADISFNLVKNGIHPDYNLYRLADIKSAITEGIGAEPLIRCSRGPFGKFQLFEVHICVDNGGSAAIDCPVKPKFTCSEEILFHPYRGWMLNDTTKGIGTGSVMDLLPIDVE
ncbi:ribonuclease 1-like, partial [Phalaenopsis equestris]|uniref:ribonuclease 1-like n=1 Tax=Phalaenopsis equestris TaxID=78828 RepID=UPI0009E51AAD